MIVKHPREYVVDKLQYALNPKTIAVVGAVILQKSAIKLLMAF